MVGFGWDIHKLAEGLRLAIGGVEVESEKGAQAHSDGDVLFHALCDALLGAASLGDIGELFPDIDARYKNADSSIFVKEVITLLEERNLQIVNIDATIVLERPKLKSYKAEIKKNVAKLCKVEEERINVKAKTSEGLDAVGKGEAIAAYCVCQIEYGGI